MRASSLHIVLTLKHMDGHMTYENLIAQISEQQNQQTELLAIMNITHPGRALPVLECVAQCLSV